MASNIVHYPNFSIVEGDVKVNIDFGKVSDRINQAQYWLDNQIMTDMVPMMPHQTGILDILKAINDEELAEQEKAEVMLKILYIDWQEIPARDQQKALEKGKEFIDCGISGEKKKGPALMDWEKDSPIIAPAINKVLGKDARLAEEIHWWTFMAAYMEISDCLFSHVVAIRQKRAKKQKLETWEREFYQNNKKLVDLEEHDRGRSKEEANAIRELLGFKKR